MHALHLLGRVKTVQKRYENLGEMINPNLMLASDSIESMDLAEIQQAIEGLPKDQQAALATWLSEREQEEWDAEMERDFSPGGAGISLLEEMKADARTGKFRPFEQGQPQRR